MPVSVVRQSAPSWAVHARAVTNPAQSANSLEQGLAPRSTGGAMAQKPLWCRLLQAAGQNEGASRGLLTLSTDRVHKASRTSSSQAAPVAASAHKQCRRRRAGPQAACLHGLWACVLASVENLGAIDMM